MVFISVFFLLSKIDVEKVSDGAVVRVHLDKPESVVLIVSNSCQNFVFSSPYASKNHTFLVRGLNSGTNFLTVRSLSRGGEEIASRTFSFRSGKLPDVRVEIENGSAVLMFGEGVKGKVRIEVAGKNGRKNYEYLISQKEKISIPVTGQEVLTIRGNGWIKTVPVVIKPRNVALKKPVWGTFARLPVSRFVDDSTPVISRVNDGRDDWLGGMAVSREVSLGEQFAVVNLESVKNLRLVVVKWHSLAYPKEYAVVYSRDGNLWKSIRRISDEFKDAVSSTGNPMKVDLVPVNIKAKFVGVFVDRGTEIIGRNAYRNCLELMELEVYDEIY